MQKAENRFFKKQTNPLFDTVPGFDWRKNMEVDRSTYSISPGSHVLFGVVVVLNQFGSKFIQRLQMCNTD